MKLLVIGHPLRFGKIKTELKSNFNEIRAEYMEYWDYSETNDVLKYVKNNKKSIDALLFTGELAFKWFSAKMFNDIVSDYVYKDSGSLLKMLLQALNKGYDIFNISIDSYDKDLVDEVYEELELDRDKSIHICPKYIFQGNNYTKDVYLFHKKNFYEKKVSCCITAISNIYENLSNDNIPCFLFQPTRDVIKNTLLKLQLKHCIQVNEYSQIVAISLEIDLPDEESIINKDEYQIILENMEVSKQVYIFAKKIEAAVQEVNFRGFMLFSTKKILEIETENLQNFDIFEMVNENTLSKISVGIGYGKTAREARYHANLGLLKAKKYGGNKTFILYDSKTIVGPIDYLKKSMTKTDSNKIDEKFLNIAEKCEISVNTIFKLYNIVQQQKKDCFTSHELAEYFGTTPRTIYRIINKLEQNGFAKIIGKKIISDIGRPSRLIKLLFY